MSAPIQVRFSGRDINLDMANWETIKMVRKEVIRILEIDKKKYNLKLKLRTLGHSEVSEYLSLLNLKDLKDLEYNGSRMILYSELVRKEDKCTIM